MSEIELKLYMKMILFAILYYILQRAHLALWCKVGWYLSTHLKGLQGGWGGGVWGFKAILKLVSAEGLGLEDQILLGLDLCTILIYRLIIFFELVYNIYVYHEAIGTQIDFLMGLVKLSRGVYFTQN